MFIPKWRLEISSARSGGPGGQHVNKTESKIEVRFKVDEADWIPEFARMRLKILHPNRINKEGEFILTCEKHRSQGQNLSEALEMLSRLLDEAARPPKRRIKTKVSRSSKRKRLEGKRHLSAKKSLRRSGGDED